MLRSITTYNEVDILYTLITYVNYSSSPDMYYTIAQTILSHLDDMPHISINDLASMCYTSPATISRFCKDLNCGSFANFKKELQIALDLANDEIHLEEEDEKALNDNPYFESFVSALQLIYLYKEYGKITTIVQETLILQLLISNFFFQY